METGNVQSPDGVTLVGRGVLDSSDLVDSVARAPLLVAADGGANSCLSEGYAPDVVIGDLDSISDETRRALPDARFIKVDEQDTTDFEKCLLRIDAPFILATGFTGGRLDHTLTVLSVLARRIGPPTVLISEKDIVFAAPQKMSMDIEPGTRVSLFPLTPLRGSSDGLKWPIDELHLQPTGQISSSNEAVGQVRLAFDSPGCLVIMPRVALDPALEAMTG